jgi:hypothetical protein
MGKKRKFSDLTAEQTSRVRQILLSCREACEELEVDDDDDNLQELNRIAKLTDTKVCTYALAMLDSR